MTSLLAEIPNYFTKLYDKSDLQATRTQTTPPRAPKKWGLLPDFTNELLRSSNFVSKIRK